ncbi:hypothetical protein LI82_09680 [Methanococcoides methylutens]|uniref:DUF7308 domain-containing protein n=1 Tax=Methanococcoides methylutens TaxID=2226 RepID=A0A099T1J9_METMT|nr:hypothetical protein [Methanococcoides methylutens]KGK98008.1 hypothetical protein LI82_09680 [Methanococcoides methylutens]
MTNNQRLFESCKAVSSVVGLLLMYSLAIVAIGVILVYNVPVLSDMQDNAQAQKIEQGFTIMDSRISKVALGESPLQTTSVSLMGGTIDVNSDDSDESKITVIIINNSTVVENFSSSLGTVEYKNGDRTIAYEGGGIWSDYGSEGGTVMVSPPEFHYNGVTLTLPIMNITGQSSAGGEGNVAITVASDNEPRILYPISNTLRENPVDHDKVDVYIKSQYYKAWADYANSLTYASATVNDSTKTATIHFSTEPPQGEFTPMPYEFRMGMVDPLEDEPIEDFVFDLEAIKKENKTGNGYRFNPTDQEIIATSGDRTLSYIFKAQGGMDVWVTYVDEELGYAEKWECVNSIPIEEKDIDIEVIKNEGKKNEKIEVIPIKSEYVQLNMTDSTFKMRYVDQHTGSYYNDYNTKEPDFSWNLTGPTTELPNYEIKYYNESLSINDLTQHYFKLLTKDGSIIVRTNERPKNGGDLKETVDYDTSTLTLNYKGLGNYLTYLHVTENKLDVTLE